MKNNYPIRYAVRPIVEQIGWSHGLNELEREYGTVAYIVSKCYVISQTKRYFQNGEEDENYSVVFPYQKDSAYSEYYRVDPSFNIYEQCINSTVVDKIFMTREEAMEEARILNEKIVKRKIVALHYNSKFKDNVREIRESQKEKLEDYKFLEELSKEKTSDMIVGAPFKEQKIILISNGKVKISDNSLYDFIRVWSGQEFLVFNVSVKKFELLKKKVYQEDIDCKSFDENLLLEGIETGEVVKINNYDNEQGKGCFYIQNNLMSYDANLDAPRRVDGDDSKIKVYTIETYGDVINSYIPNYIYNASEFLAEEAKVLEKGIIRKSDFHGDN